MVLVSNENVSISVCMKYWLWQQISWRCDLHIFIYLFLLNIAVTSSQNVTKRILIHNQTVHCNRVPAAIMLHFYFKVELKNKLVTLRGAVTEDLIQQSAWKVKL